MKDRSVIVGYARTPFGKFGGSLKEKSAVDLGAVAIKEAVERSGIEKEDIELVIMGQVLSGGCGQIPARQAMISAGLSDRIPVDQVNKVCASSMRALTLADTIIRAGDSKIIVTGGMESMSNAPFISRNIRWGNKMFDVALEDMMVKDGLWCPIYNRHMALHGSSVASKYNVSRESQDEWAFQSQKKAVNAIKAGYLKREITPVLLSNGNYFSEDEAPREDTTLEKLSKLSPIFDEKGTVTAGNAPGVNDGASAIVLMSEGEADKRNIDPEAAIVSYAMYSEDPENIATAPGNAINKLLSGTDIQKDDVGLWEINEAFAAVALVSSKIADIDINILNVNGGAVAYGHPIGASGGRIIMTLVSEMQRRNVRYGVAAICSGTGQGDAVLIENCKYK